MKNCLQSVQKQDEGGFFHRLFGLPEASQFSRLMRGVDPCSEILNAAIKAGKNVLRETHFSVKSAHSWW